MNILLIDDHTLFREGLALLLAPLPETPPTIWQAGSCDEAFACIAERGEPDLVLIDLTMPGLPGLDGIALLRERHPQVPVVALSSADDRDTVLRAIDAGAMGFVPKSSTSSVLLAALRLILASGIYLPPSVVSSRAGDAAVATPVAPPRPSGVVGAPPGPSAGRRPSDLGLSPRQAEVLWLILQGHSTKLIQRALDLSASTVKAHTSAVLRALNVTTRTQAVIAAGRLGLRFDGVVRGAAPPGAQAAPGAVASGPTGASRSA